MIGPYSEYERIEAVQRQFYSPIELIPIVPGIVRCVREKQGVDPKSGDRLRTPTLQKAIAGASTTSLVLLSPASCPS